MKRRAFTNEGNKIIPALFSSYFQFESLPVSVVQLLPVDVFDIPVPSSFSPILFVSNAYVLFLLDVSVLSLLQL